MREKLSLLGIITLIKRQASFALRKKGKVGRRDWVGQEGRLLKMRP